MERFPDSEKGLNILEYNILKIVRDQKVKSKHHLLGYALNYQGYYGYGDLQINRIIEKLSMFLVEDEEKLMLTRQAHEVLQNLHNVANNMKNDMVYGGIKKYQFQFNKKLNKLVKTV